MLSSSHLRDKDQYGLTLLFQPDNTPHRAQRREGEGEGGGGGGGAGGGPRRESSSVKVS